MKDCVGKELNIGDKVICSDMHYADLLIGEIVGFTPKKARVRYVRSEYQQAYGQTSQHEQLKETYQIFKYEDAAQPTADVVEVVKCEDCIHREYCNQYVLVLGDERELAFCGYGER